MSTGDKVDAFISPLRRKSFTNTCLKNMFVLSAVFPKIVSVYTKTKTTVNSLQVFNMAELNPGVFNPLAVVCLGHMQKSADMLPY